MQDVQGIQWLSFLAGALVGWLIEWAMDYFYWRHKYAKSTVEVVEVEPAEVDED
jgi:hypothetical protein